MLLTNRIKTCPIVKKRSHAASMPLCHAVVMWLCASVVQEIANFILQEQSPKRLYEVRGKLYELLVNCLPPELILRRLALELFRKLDDELRHKVSELAAFYEHRLQVKPPSLLELHKAH